MDKTTVEFEVTFYKQIVIKNIFFVLVVVLGALSDLYFSGHNGHKEDTKFTK